MPKLLPTVALMVVTLFAAPYTRASETGMVLAARAGFGLPVGNAVEDRSLGELYSSKLPLWAEVGYRLNKNFSVGAYLQYAIGFVDKCMEGASCSGSIVRLGFEGIYRILPDITFVPWVGAGIGYEFASWSRQQGGTIQQISLSGFEFFNLQIGADYRLNPTFSIGPYLAFSFAQFSNGSANNQDVAFGKSAHGWLQYGIKGTFDL